MKMYRYVRWLFLALGLLAILSLTGMNIYSLYALHESKVRDAAENQKRQLMEFTNQVQNRLRYPVNDFWQLDIARIQDSFKSPGQIDRNFNETIYLISRDTLFSGIYLTPSECGPCDHFGAPIWRYNNLLGVFQQTTEYSRQVSAGLDMARQRVSSGISEYLWNTDVIFDAHNSMTIVLIDPQEKKIIGYLTFMINIDFLVHSYMGPKLREIFGTGERSGVIVWLHDWTKNEVITTTSINIPYSYQQVDYIQNFPDLLNEWNLKASFRPDPNIAESRSDLIRNLFILGTAVLLLISALIFIFYTAHRERSLAKRQARFLANVTHELKTPLSVILAAGENLSDGRVTDPARLKSYGSHIYTESMRLRNMIERLLDVARSNQQGFIVNKKKTNLKEFVLYYFEINQSYLESSGVAIEINAEDELPEILVDVSDLHSILDNLVDNAIKYSPDEKYLGVGLEMNGHYLKLSMEDRGMGIPREAQKYIFDKFFRVEDAMNARTKGHGLGLSIVKDLVTRNGGSIRVSSTPGRGSVFLLFFPLAHTFEVKNVTKPDLSLNQPEPEHAHE